MHCDLTVLVHLQAPAAQWNSNSKLNRSLILPPRRQQPHLLRPRVSRALRQDRRHRHPIPFFPLSPCRNGSTPPAVQPDHHQQQPILQQPWHQQQPVRDRSAEPDSRRVPRSDGVGSPSRVSRCTAPSRLGHTRLTHTNHPHRPHASTPRATTRTHPGR